MTAADRAIVNTIFANYGKALEAYTRTLVSRNAPFDRWVAGDLPLRPDVHRPGLPRPGRPADRRARTGLAQVDSMRGTFRTKGLRGVASSAPYMHAGQLATLEAVVEFYDDGGGDPGATGIVKDARIVPLGLTDGEKADLVEFMRS